MWIDGIQALNDRRRAKKKEKKTPGPLPLSALIVG